VRCCRWRQTMRWEPQWSHRSAWQPSENWRTFHLDSVFIVRSDHQNFSHRAVGEGEVVFTSHQSRKGGVGQEIDGHPGIIDTVLGFQVPARPINTDKSKPDFQLFCVSRWRKTAARFIIFSVRQYCTALYGRYVGCLWSRLLYIKYCTEGRCLWDRQSIIL
jgi:hypothetical protein